MLLAIRLLVHVHRQHTGTALQFASRLWGTSGHAPWQLETAQVARAGVTANNDELAAIGHLASLMRSRGKGACGQEFEEHLVRLVAGRQQALLQRGDIAAANRHPYHGECPEGGIY